MTPQEIVDYLDQYIIGQKEAKRTIALALRNRYRRMRLPEELQDEIMPKNILMIGSTGIGKTEIARRLAKMMKLPFIKVEASKYTEVGFVGRDVESMIRDLVAESIRLTTLEHKEKSEDLINDYITRKITEKIMPPLPKATSEKRQEEYKNSFAKMSIRVHNGELDDKKIEVEIKKSNFNIDESSNLPPEVSNMQESIMKLMGTLHKDNIKKEVTVKEAKEILRLEASDKVIDAETVKKEAIERVENGGIVFIDEIDKIAISSKSQRSDPSKEGVQRDLLPIVEGSNVSTKYGQVKTDHILFISAGAFQLSKPSDLIPELQGRFPLRVELTALDEEALYKILTLTKNSLLRQYEALLSVEDVKLMFDDKAIRAIAKLSQLANEKTEDIGARRLHTVLERILEDISFYADKKAGETITITEELVHTKLDDLIDNEDLARYIL